MDGHLQRNIEYNVAQRRSFYDDSIPNLPLIFLSRIFYTLNKQSSICDFPLFFQQKILLIIFCRTLKNCQGFETIND